MPPYNKFQYIAYQVPTLVKDSGNTNHKIVPAGEADENQLDTYLAQHKMVLRGDVGKLSDDSRTRVKRLLGVMIKARKDIIINNEDTVLKIFMAPEFYFRPVTPGAFPHPIAYSDDEYKAIVSVLEQSLLESKGDSRELLFKNWLVIPGTIFWTTFGLLHFFNYVAWFHYFTISEGSGNVFSKYSTSTIDGIPIGQSGHHLRPELQGEAEKRKHLFLINNIQVGLEICLEHSLGILKNVVDHINPHLQLITACGMSMKTDKVCARTNGFVLRTDGFRFNTNAPQVEMKKITGNDADGNSTLSNNYLSTERDLDGTPLFLPRPEDHKPSTWFQQMIRIFPIQTLP